jgi:hypothetical protein
MLQPIFRRLEAMGFVGKSPILALQFLFEKYEEVEGKLNNLSAHYQEMLDKAQEQAPVLDKETK